MKKAAVIAPANTMAGIPEVLRAIGIKNLSEIGYEVIFGENIDRTHFHTAGSRQERIDDLNWALANPEIELILPVFGGYNSNQLLGRINHKQRTGKKVLMGFSDTTSLLAEFARRDAYEVFHGPSFSVFCDPNLFSYTKENCKRALAGDTLTYRAPPFTASDQWYLKPGFGPRDVLNEGSWKTYQEGEITGKLCGGNIETLSSLAGTPYFPSLEGKILILEDSTGTNPGAFDRSLTQFYQMGVFGKIAGLIIGRFPNGSKLLDASILHDILGGVIDSQDLPVVYGVHCSHTDPMLTLPFHSSTHLVAGEEPKITINYK